MELKTGYKILSIFSVILGLTLLISLENTIVGNVINKNEIQASATALWSSFFIITGIILYYLQTIKH